MPFFSDAGPGGFEPKRTHRWTVSFKSLGQDLVFMATKVKKPSFKQTPKTHQFMNHVFKYPGIVTWDDIEEISFIDAFEPDVGSVFYNVLLNSGYDIPSNFTNSLLGLTKTAAVSTIGDVVIRQLDGGHRVDFEQSPGSLVGPTVGPFIREEWTLKNAFVNKAAWSGEMQYNEEANLVEVSIGLSFDYATLTTSNTSQGLGQYV
jgi:hypothetical protein